MNIRLVRSYLVYDQFCRQFKTSGPPADSPQGSRKPIPRLTPTLPLYPRGKRVLKPDPDSQTSTNRFGLPTARIHQNPICNCLPDGYNLAERASNAPRRQPGPSTADIIVARQSLIPPRSVANLQYWRDLLFMRFPLQVRGSAKPRMVRFTSGARW